MRVRGRGEKGKVQTLSNKIFDNSTAGAKGTLLKRGGSHFHITHPSITNGLIRNTSHCGTI